MDNLRFGKLVKSSDTSTGVSSHSRVTAVGAGQPGLLWNQMYPWAQGWPQLWATRGDPARPEECSIKREIIVKRIHIMKINSGNLLNSPTGKALASSRLTGKGLKTSRAEVDPQAKRARRIHLTVCPAERCSCHQEVPGEGVLGVGSVWLPPNKPA